MPGLENRSRMQTLSGPTSLGVLPFGEAMQVPSCWHEPALRSVATVWVDSLSGSTGERLFTSPAVGALLGEEPPSSTAVGRGIPSVEIALQELLRRFWRAEEVLSAHFIFEDAPAVGAFLASHSRISAALRELMVVLRDLVPTAETPSLRVVTDPLDLEIRELQVRIPLAIEPAEALAKIEEVDDAWWMRQPSEIRRLVTVDAVYR